MNKTTYLITSLIGLTLLMGAGCTPEPNTNTVADTVSPTTNTTTPVLVESTEPLSYSTDGVDVTVSKTTAPFDFTAEQLKANADECGTEQEAGITLLYFDELVAKFSGTTKTIYSFKYEGASQSPDTFVVTVVPNKPEYISMFGQFSKDFDVCVAGGDAYPKKLNNDWLLFTSSCGSGADDGSGLPVGCDEVKKVVEPSLELNSDTVDTTASVDVITYEQFTVSDTGVTFDVPSDVTVTENMNGVPGLSKFTYDGNSYLISYSAEQGDSELAWGGSDENEVTVTSHDNISVYSENGYARTAAFFLQPHPLANITVTKSVGVGYSSESETSSDLDEVYQRLVASVKIDGVAAF